MGRGGGNNACEICDRQISDDFGNFYRIPEMSLPGKLAGPFLRFVRSREEPLTPGDAATVGAAIGGGGAFLDYVIRCGGLLRGELV